MRPLRMATRRWMIAVAVVALAFGAERLRRLSQGYAFLAACHAGAQISLAEVVGDYDGGRIAFDQQEATSWVEAIAAYRRRIPYEAALARKYRRAARYPWLPDEPDPPDPM